MESFKAYFTLPQIHKR